MNVELIYDRDCPNAAAARAQLLKAFAESGVSANWTEWDRSTPDGPTHIRQFGSPTILVAGQDVAGEPPRDGSAHCRLYRNSDGTMQGVPPAAVIAAALAKYAPSPSTMAAAESPGWKSSLAAAPGIAFALLPKLACPACWPAYAGLLGSLGLGFLIQARYLFPLTAGFLALAVAALAFHAGGRRGYGPVILGVAASTIVLIGKFLLDADIALYAGIGLLIAASVWNAWPRGKNATCPACEDRPSTPPYTRNRRPPMAAKRPSGGSKP